METILQDVRFAARMLARKPAFTIVVVLTMALGIGATTAVFSVVNAFLLRPLPYADADRLVMIQSHDGTSPRGVSYVDYGDWRGQAESFEDMAFLNIRWQANVHFDGESETVTSSICSANLFSVLEVRPLIGHDFTSQEKIVFLSHDLWQRRFGGDPNITEKKLNIEGGTYRVAGVMPQGFKFPSQTELWVPTDRLFNKENRAMRIDQVIARMKPNVEVEQARAEMKAITARLASAYPDTNAGFGAVVTPLRDFQIGDIKSPLMLLFAACAFLLLIACANVANLLLARSAARGKEIAIRAALGASRARLIRQMLTESVLLAVVGGVLALLLALWGVEALTALIPVELPFWIKLSLDARVLAFTFAVSVITGLIFGLVPAFASSRATLSDALKASGRSQIEGWGRSRTRSLLVVAEVALAMTLLVGAGLVVKSLVNLQNVNPGFDTRNVLMVGVKLTFDIARTNEQRAEIYDRVIRRVAALPGIISAGANHDLPFVGQMVWNRATFAVEGQSPEEAENNPTANQQRVSPDYFRTMGIPLIRGRSFDERDRIGSPLALIINQKMAERFWPGEDPVGKRLTGFGPDDAVWNIIGVVGDIKYRGLAGETEYDLYGSCIQLPPPVILHLVARTDKDAASMAATVRREISAISSDLGISRMIPLEKLAENTIWQPRLWGLLFGVFSVVALALAAAGIYGVLSYLVSQRTREIGIRMALGAESSRVLRMVIRQGMAMALAGVAVGLAAAFLLTRAMSSLLYGVSATDPFIFIAVPTILTGVALGACFVPARRAARVDPMVSLRAD